MSQTPTPQGTLGQAVSGALTDSAPLLNTAADTELATLATSLPPAYASLVNTYGPVFIAMGAAKLSAWLAQAISGPDGAYAAYQTLLKSLGNQQLLAEFEAIQSGFQTANAANAAQLASAKSSAQAFIDSVLKVALAALLAAA